MSLLHLYDDALPNMPRFANTLLEAGVVESRLVFAKLGHHVTADRGTLDMRTEAGREAIRRCWWRMLEELRYSGFGACSLVEQARPVVSPAWASDWDETTRCNWEHRRAH